MESSKVVDTTERKGSAPPPPPTSESKKNYKGFVAGVFSGIAKLSGMSPPHCVFISCVVFGVFFALGGWLILICGGLVGHPYVLY